MLLIGKMKKRKTGRKRDKEGGKEQEKEKKEKQRGGRRKNNKLNILHVQCKKHYHFYFIKEKNGTINIFDPDLLIYLYLKCVKRNFRSFFLTLHATHLLRKDKVK